MSFSAPFATEINHPVGAPTRRELTVVGPEALELGLGFDGGPAYGEVVLEQ
jgi:hypothetical protein